MGDFRRGPRSRNLRDNGGRSLAGDKRSAQRNGRRSKKKKEEKKEHELEAKRKLPRDAQTTHSWLISMRDNAGCPNDLAKVEFDRTGLPVAVRCASIQFPQKLPARNATAGPINLSWVQKVEFVSKQFSQIFKKKINKKKKERKERTCRAIENEELIHEEIERRRRRLTLHFRRVHDRLTIRRRRLSRLRSASGGQMSRKDSGPVRFIQSGSSRGGAHLAPRTTSTSWTKGNPIHRRTGDISARYLSSGCTGYPTHPYSPTRFQYH